MVGGVGTGLIVAPGIFELCDEQKRSLIQPPAPPPKCACTYALECLHSSGMPIVAMLGNTVSPWEREEHMTICLKYAMVDKPIQEAVAVAYTLRECIGHLKTLNMVRSLDNGGGIDLQAVQLRDAVIQEIEDTFSTPAAFNGIKTISYPPNGTPWASSAANSSVLQMAMLDGSTGAAYGKMGWGASKARLSSPREVAQSCQRDGWRNFGPASRYKEYEQAGRWDDLENFPDKPLIGLGFMCLGHNNVDVDTSCSGCAPENGGAVFPGLATFYECMGGSSLEDISKLKVLAIMIRSSLEHFKGNRHLKGVLTRSYMDASEYHAGVAAACGYSELESVLACAMFQSPKFVESAGACSGANVLDYLEKRRLNQRHHFIGADVDKPSRCMPCQGVEDTWGKDMQNFLGSEKRMPTPYDMAGQGRKKRAMDMGC